MSVRGVRVSEVWQFPSRQVWDIWLSKFDFRRMFVRSHHHSSSLFEHYFSHVYNGRLADVDFDAMIDAAWYPDRSGWLRAVDS